MSSTANGRQAPTRIYMLEHPVASALAAES
jgi:hypothetical protein